MRNVILKVSSSYSLDILLFRNETFQDISLFTSSPERPCLCFLRLFPSSLSFSFYLYLLTATENVVKFGRARVWPYMATISPNLFFSLVGHHSCYLSALQRQIIVIAAERFVLCESIRGLKNRGSFHPSIFLPSFSQLSSSFLPLSLSPPSCARKNSSTFPLSLSRNGRKNGRALFYSVNVFFHSSNAAVP